MDEVPFTPGANPQIIALLLKLIHFAVLNAGVTRPLPQVNHI